MSTTKEKVSQIFEKIKEFLQKYYLIVKEFVEKYPTHFSIAGGILLGIITFILYARYFGTSDTSSSTKVMSDTSSNVKDPFSNVKRESFLPYKIGKNFHFGRKEEALNFNSNMKKHGFRNSAISQKDGTNNETHWIVHIEDLNTGGLPDGDNLYDNILELQKKSNDFKLQRSLTALGSSLTFIGY